MNKTLRRTLKILGWTVGSILILLLLVVVLVQVPVVQQFLRGKAVAYLESKLGTKVQVGHLSIAFPKKIVLENVYFEDQKKDTLLAGERIAVDLAMFKLIKGRVELNDIELTGIRANIYRKGSDTAFNYDYIIKAFTTPTATPKPADTSGIDLSIDHIALSRITSTFRDDQSGADMYLYIGGFDSRIKKFDLNHSAYDIAGISLDNVVARVYQHKPLLEPKTTAEVQAANTGAPALTLTLGKTSLKNIDADYANDISALSARLKLGELTVVPEKLDMQHLQIALQSLVLNNTDAVITLGRTAAAKEVAEQASTAAQAQAANPWRVTLGKVELSGNHLKFDNNNTPRAPKGMDYAHLDVQNLGITASNIALTPEMYAGDVSDMHLREANARFGLQKLQAAFVYDEHGVRLDNLYVQTDKSLLRDSIALGWASLDKLATQPGEMMLRANLPNCILAVSDVLTFAPMLATAPPFYHNESAVFKVNARLEGYVKDLNIPRFEASGMSGTSIAVSGRIKGLPDPVHTVYNLNIGHLRTNVLDIAKLAPPGSIPPTVRVPEMIALHGFFTGSMQAFNTHLDIQTSRGTADIAATMRNMTSYSVNATVGALDVGYLTKQEATVGRISGHVQANGSGFDPKTMVANVQANIAAAQVQGYTYRNASVTAKFNHGDVAANGFLHDANASLSFDATALMKGTYPALKLNAQLDSLNLGALGFYQGDLRLHGHIGADFASTNPDALIGTAELSDLIVYNAGQRYAAPDTIRIAAASEGGTNTLDLASEMLTAHLNGQYKLTEIAAAVMHTINRYYAIPGFKETPFAPQTWTLTAAIHPSTLLLTLLPALRGSDSIVANVAFNSAADDLRMTANARRIVYGTNVLDSLTAQVSTGDALNYSVSLQNAVSGQFRLNHTSVAGAVANNTISTALDIRDAADKQQYGLSAMLNQTPANGIRVALNPGLMLDYDTWNVGGDNFIEYSDKGIIVHNFSISNGTQSIAAASTTDVPTAPVDVRFTAFRIGTITKIAAQDSLLVDGLINGTAELRNPATNLTFTSDLAINNLSYLRDTVGDLTVKVNNETANTLAANIQLLGHGNDVRLDGRYFLSDSRLDMNLNIANLALASIKPFSAGQITDIGGALRGQMAVAGTTAKPSINGAIRFDSAFVVPTLLGERFALTNDQIAVNATGIHFNNFTIADSASNKVNINGDVLTTDYTNYRFGLSITADNFHAVNSTRGNGNKPFYGDLNLTTKTTIKGDMNLPVINSSLRINRGTDFSYVLPSNDPEVQSRIGVVEFVDNSAPQDSNIFKYARAQDSALEPVGAMDLTARIQTDSGALFHVVIDERNGDAIHIRGTAALEAAVDRSGKISLTGTYIMQEGSYLLTLNFLKRKFDVKPGSSITWDGDPLSAQVDITAIYTANTAPIDLIEHQLGGRSDYEVNQYKQRVPFQVLLNMKGELMKPQITFDIQMNDRDASRFQDVSTKLAQVRTDESELNKQVFALLLLGHFVDENPLESNGAPTTGESFVRESASRVLTDQLNRLAGSLVKGVELNFGLTSGSDYSTGDLQQRTDLNVGLSKRLLNDRLKVNVGSSFELEGARNSNQAASNIAGDVEVDYQLSKDGRHILRGYRRNNYEGVVEGQVIETGATYIFRVEYDRLRQIFHHRKPKATTTSTN